MGASHALTRRLTGYAARLPPALIILLSKESEWFTCGYSILSYKCDNARNSAFLFITRFINTHTQFIFLMAAFGFFGHPFQFTAFCCKSQPPLGGCWLYSRNNATLAHSDWRVNVENFWDGSRFYHAWIWAQSWRWLWCRIMHGGKRYTWSRCRKPINGWNCWRGTCFGRFKVWNWRNGRGAGKRCRLLTKYSFDCKCKDQQYDQNHYRVYD